MSVSPVGGPINGRTSVTLSASGAFPVRDWALLRCRFGPDIEVPISALSRTNSTLDGVEQVVDLGRAGQVVCITPPLGSEADLQITLTLNGQQFAYGPSLFYSSLVSASIRGPQGALAETLPGVRFRFFTPPSVFSLTPNVGPVRGGTLLRVRGVGFSANALHGGGAEVRCRVGLGAGAIVAGTIETPQQIACRSPPHRTGLSTVLISLNGGAEWYANNSMVSPAAPLQQLQAVTFRFECEPNDELAPCLRDRGCGWCYESLRVFKATTGAMGPAFNPQAAALAGASGGRCMPCAADNATGVPRCDLGPRPSAEVTCSSWTHVHELSIVSGVGARSERVDLEVEASRMMYVRVAPPHPYGTLRLLIETRDDVGAFLQRGGAPEANLTLEMGQRWPLDLPARRDARAFATTTVLSNSGATLAQELSGTVPFEHNVRLPTSGHTLMNATSHLALDRAAGGAATLDDADAWYLGIQGRAFYMVTIGRAGRVEMGDVLEPPIADGTQMLTHPPNDGNFQVIRNSSSRFRAFVAWDFDFRDFRKTSCGARPDACGLVTLGGASAGGDNRSATLLRGRPMDVGAIWQREKLPLDGGFVTTFNVRVTNRSLCADGEACTERIGGGGFALVIQNAADGADALGCPAEGMGLLRRAGCNACVAPALAIRLDTYADLRWDGKRQAFAWTYHNQLRLHSVDCRPAAASALPAPLLATDLGPHVTIDDGNFHLIDVRYIFNQLTVYVDRQLVLFTELELTPHTVQKAPVGVGLGGDGAGGGGDAGGGNTNAAFDAIDDAARTREHLQETVLSTRHVTTADGAEARRVMSAGVLDERGHGRLGLVGASGAIGHEQYEVRSWRFERVVTMPKEVGPPRTPEQAHALAAAAAEAAIVAAARAPPALPVEVVDESGGGAFGSGEPASGTFESSNEASDSGSGGGEAGSGGGGDVGSGGGDVGSGGGEGDAQGGDVGSGAGAGSGATTGDGAGSGADEVSSGSGSS